jgi:elongation factor P
MSSTDGSHYQHLQKKRSVFGGAGARAIIPRCRNIPLTGGRTIASTSDFRNGLVLDIGGSLMRIVEFQHVKPGKGAAFVRTKLKNVETGQVVDKTFRAGEKVEEAVLEHKKMQYLYKDGDNFIFMDLETYEQTTVPEGTVGDTANFLVENQELSVFIRNGKAVTMELPPAVHLKVAEAEPGLKGDTSSGATKPVTLETGLVIQAPLFVNEGETLKVDTRTGRYIERV